MSSRQIGFRAESRVVDVAAGDTTTVAFYLEPTVTELDAVFIRERPL